MNFLEFILIVPRGTLHIQKELGLFNKKVGQPLFVDNLFIKFSIHYLLFSSNNPKFVISIPSVIF